jgi:hypothetical protein
MGSVITVPGKSTPLRRGSSGNGEADGILPEADFDMRGSLAGGDREVSADR